jgi:asparagine synthase (glutamine-hydrolysing)
MEPEPPYIADLVSEESLRKTGYFDPAAVRHWRQNYQHLRPGSLPRLSVDGGLTAVVATQLWHQLYIDPSLTDKMNTPSVSA